MMKIKFCGAARQVTGSMHLLELNDGYKVLIDCGLDYEQQKGFHRGSRVEFAFNPASIDLVVLTHAHVDHSGNLPTLVRHGFQGNIICSPPTAEITGDLLVDSLKIMEMEARKQEVNRKKGKKSGLGSIYGYRDLQQALDRMITLHFYQEFKVNDLLSITFQDAGHILGAASVKLKVKNNGKESILGFTGDLGNYGSKLMKDPLPFENIDFLITESTYGGRKHQAKKSGEDELHYWIEETCVKQAGRLVIPAFSVGRTQAIVFAINELSKQGRLPDVPIFVDSPLAIRTTDTYSKFPEYLNESSQRFLKRHGDLFDFPGLHFIRDKKDSERLQDHYEPCVIVSAAGMMEGGRIQEHVRNNIRNAYSTILIAGFCAEGTLGHRLLNGQGHVIINGKEYPVFAKVERTDAFSAHPDHAGLMEYINASGGKSLKGIFLVHGEESAMLSLESDMHLNGFENVFIPYKDEEFELI